MSEKKREKKLLAKIKTRAEKRKQRQTPDRWLQQTPMADITAPEGFQVVSATQGMMSFLEPLFAYSQSDDMEEMDRLMGVGVAIWNFTLPQIPARAKPAKEELIELICETLELDEDLALAFFDEMIGRKAWLFPEDVQPANPAMLFMRKEEVMVIERFDEADLNLSETPIPPDKDDHRMLDILCRLDQAIMNGDDYDKWEDLYFSAEDQCCQQFDIWLGKKGVPDELCQQLPFCVQIFLDFVYRYTANRFLDITEHDLVDFLRDHLLRKVMIQPADYAYWPPALRLFATFLHEKGYLDNPQPFIALLNDIEPEFIETLKKQY